MGHVHARDTISIHAPVKGATNVAEYYAHAPKISIHAPVKGATLAYVEFQFDKANFNPRSREGSDKIVMRHIESHDDFNPRSREGSDYNFSCRKIRSYNFNPRSREGSDYLPIPLAPGMDYFNPRSREGSDSLQIWVIGLFVIFQSTLP